MSESQNEQHSIIATKHSTTYSTLIPKIKNIKIYSTSSSPWVMNHDRFLFLSGNRYESWRHNPAWDFPINGIILTVNRHLLSSVSLFKSLTSESSRIIENFKKYFFQKFQNSSSKSQGKRERCENNSRKKI